MAIVISSPARCRVVVVVDVDGDLAEIPLLGARVHHEHRRYAARKSRHEELVRRRRGALTTDRHGLVGGEMVPTVDHDLLPERAGDRPGCAVRLMSART